MKKSFKWLAGAVGFGWTLAIVGIVLLFGCMMLVVAGAASTTQDEPNELYTGLSPVVEQYRELVTAYCTQYGIPDYVDLALAVMQQESGGKSLDVMQASECAYNTQYPKQPGGITNPEYSIDCGVHTLADCLRAAAIQSNTDIDGISLALQGYNFGNGYIPWALDRGGYSLENAMEFSKEQAAAHGWKSYGDPQYVPHVLRYYALGGVPATPDGYLTHPLAPGTYTITSPFGPRTEPSIGFHFGIDFGATEGTYVYASESGAVTASVLGNSSNGYDGYGNVVVIDHGNGYRTLYAHNAELLVSQGETVGKGQRIAKVGSTGNSTGPHCHFEVRHNAVRVDPTPYLNQETSIR